MKNLKWLREQGEMMNQADQAGLVDLSIADSLNILDLLYQGMRPMLDATENLYRPEREKYLTMLQSRLYKFKKWEQLRERPLRKRTKTTKKTR